MDTTWNKLLSRFYRKRELYSLPWNIDLSKSYLEGAKFGGPLAVTQDHRKGPVIDPNIQIFTSSGLPIATFAWDRGYILKMGWTSREELIVVLESGMVFIFSLFGELINDFKISQEGRVIDCITWGEGLVVMTDRLRFYSVTNFDDPNPKLLADPMLDREPKSWIVIEPKPGSRYPIVLVATVTGTILVVGVERVADQFLSNGPFRKMALTPNGNMLACYTENGEIWVTPSDFQGKSSTVDTKSRNPPSQMVWCGSDTVVCCWETASGQMLLMVGPNDSVIKYDYNIPLILIPEYDGTRIITQHNCEYLQLVHQVTVDTFSSGSKSESALLLEATEYFYKRSPKADEIIRNIKSDGKLDSAVKKCIEAAGYEFTISTQRSLLKSASFGKCFMEYYTPDKFVSMCKALRVLNEVRQYQLGIPLTIEQLTVLTPRVLIDRLINRHQHLLALRICEYLQMKTDKVLVHWACTKVKSKEDDITICNAISTKLKCLPGISYAEIASTAYKAGKPNLATKLLDNEPRAADQVPLLVSMQQDKLALDKAIESGDTDLVYLVMLHVLRTKDQNEFYNILNQQREAINLYISYCKEQELVQQLQESLKKLGQHFDLSIHLAMESFTTDVVDDKVKALRQSLAILNQYCKDKLFEMKILDEQSKLVMVQKALEAELPGIQLIGKSVNQTMFSLIANGQTKQANKVKNDFKVPDKRFWWVKIQALSSISDWDRLMAFSKEKKSPIGYAPFVEVCMKKGAIQEAAKYLVKIPEPDIRVKYLIKLGAYKEAAIIASKEIKNPQEILVKIRNAAKEDPPSLAAIDQILARYQ